MLARLCQAYVYTRNFILDRSDRTSVQGSRVHNELESELNHLFLPLEASLLMILRALLLVCPLRSWG